MLLAHRIRLEATPAQRDYFARAAGTARRVWNWGMAEPLRLGGKIMGASVSREADHWFLAVQVDVPDNTARRRRSAGGIVGVDLGITAAATLSSGDKIAAPRPLQSALRRIRIRIRSRRLSHKLKATKAAAGIKGRIPKGTRLPVSENRRKAAKALARLHACIACVRRDFLHKLTTRLCRENQAVAIEDLNVKGMLATTRLARSIADIGFHAFRRQLQYKALRYGTRIVLADRWYPSSKLCSSCGAKNDTLRLSERKWRCTCGVWHDRDVNAAINLQRLATVALEAVTALPEASPAVTQDTAAGRVPVAGGKVTPVRYEHGQQDGSGQEENGAHGCAPF